jgi:ubiquinone/menaquinone biosynthesis C-methylase UbiE
LRGKDRCDYSPRSKASPKLAFLATTTHKQPIVQTSQHNVEANVVRGFGEEWSSFRQGDDLTLEQREAIFDSYFHIFPWGLLPPGGGVGLDAGCGSGRWAMMVAPRVQHLHLLDASSAALEVARENLRTAANVTFHAGTVGEIPLPDASLDFAFSLGVLHHVPDTEQAIGAIARKLKPGAPFLLYLYYALDNRPPWYRWLWAMSDGLRALISRLPHGLRRAFSETVAALVYWPLARLGRTFAGLGLASDALPLAYYADKSFYVMRTDAYDRFGTRLEKRFTRAQIEQMMRAAGLGRIRFSEGPPYWCAVGIAAAGR